jgi:hypothetical protein
MPVQRDTTSAISSSVTGCAATAVVFMSACAEASSCFSRFGNLAVLQFRHARQVTLAAARQFHLDLRARSQIARLICAAPCSEAFSALPDFLEIRVLRFSACECLRSKLFQTLLRRFVVFLLQRLTLDLQLDDAPLQTCP